jgi:hypothetical protein
MISGAGKKRTRRVRKPRKKGAKGVWSIGDRIGLGIAWITGIFL